MLDEIAYKISGLLFSSEATYLTYRRWTVSSVGR